MHLKIKKLYNFKLKISIYNIFTIYYNVSQYYNQSLKSKRKIFLISNIYYYFIYITNCFNKINSY